MCFSFKGSLTAPKYRWSDANISSRTLTSHFRKYVFCVMLLVDFCPPSTTFPISYVLACFKYASNVVQYGFHVLLAFCIILTTDTLLHLPLVFTEPSFFCIEASCLLASDAQIKFNVSTRVPASCLYWGSIITRYFIPVATLTRTSQCCLPFVAAMIKWFTLWMIWW